MNCLERFCMKVWVPVFPTAENANGEFRSKRLRRYYMACANSTMIKYARVWHELCSIYAYYLYLENEAAVNHRCTGVKPNKRKDAEERLAATYRPPGFGQITPSYDQLKEMWADPRVQDYVDKERENKQKK